MLFGLSLGAFLLFLNGPDIVTSHEARVAQPAREMAASGWPWDAKAILLPEVKLTKTAGMVRLSPNWDVPIAFNPWLVPALNGQIRLQKPPLPYWCAAVSFRLLGGFSEATLRLVPALLGALSVLLIYDIGRLLYGRRIAWLAGLVWASTYTIPEEYRKAMADPYLAFFTLGCVWSWIRAGRFSRTVGSALAARGNDDAGERVRQGGPYESAPRRPFNGWIVVFYLSLALALLAKGPAAIPDILVPLAVFQLCVRGRFPRQASAHVVGLILLLAIALPWPLYVYHHVPNALELWRYESVGEMADNTENARPWSFYLPQLPYLGAPLDGAVRGGNCPADCERS